MADPKSPIAQGSGASAGRDVTVTGRDIAAGRDVTASRDINLTTNNNYYSNSTERPVRTLRRDVTGFVGRGSQLAQLMRLLDPSLNTSPLANVRNGAGCGKTALATHAAHQVAPGFPGAHMFLEMAVAGLSPLDCGEALRRLLMMLGLTDSVIPDGVAARADMFRSRLPDGSILVLDNVMSVRQVADLLPGQPGCAVLLTSRYSLLELEGLAEVDLGPMPPDDARDLVASRIGADRAAAEPDAVREIVRLCGALPLALNIAAAQLMRPANRRLPVAALAGRLRDEHRRLDLLKTDYLDVRASFSLGYQALTPAAARMFRLLGWARVPSFSREFAEAVDGTADAPDAFDELLNSHLAEDGNDGRARFHDLLAVFARERAEKEEVPEARDSALDRAIAWCAERAAFLGDQIVPKDDRLPGTASDAAAIASLDAERDVMLAMIRRAAAEGRDTQLPLITASLGNFFDVREAWTDWLEAAELAVASAERTGDPQVVAAALLQRSWPLRLMRHTRQATADAEAALRELDDVPAGIIRGEVLSHLGTLYREAHRYDDATRCLDEAIAIFRSAGDQRREGLALRTLGHVQSWRMDLPAAQATLERGIGLLRAAHDRLGEAWSHANLCEVFGYAWRYDDAAAESATAREIFDDLGSRQGAAWALNHMGRINLQYGQITMAIDCSERALAVFRELSDEYGTGWALLHLASARRDAKLAREALAVFAAMTDPEEDGQGWALVTLARLTGDPARADEALGHFAVTGSPRGEGTALATRGDLERAAGQHDAAARSYASALPPLERYDPHRAALVRLAQAELARQAGNDDLANELTQTAQTTLTALGAPEAEHDSGEGRT